MCRVLTTTTRETVRMSVETNMPMKPTSSNVFRPAFSITTSETNVMATFMAPTPSVANCADFSERSAMLKILVEKYIAWKRDMSTFMFPLLRWQVTYWFLRMPSYRCQLLTALIPENC